MALCQRRISGTALQKETELRSQFEDRLSELERQISAALATP
jgi:hypothetical protein